MMQNLTRRLAARRLRLGPDIVQTEFMGCRMLVRPKEDVGRNMALGEFETDDLQHFLGAIRAGDRVFDIGANVGAYCVPVGHRYRTCQVTAFEPIPLNAALVRVSLLANKVDNVTVVQACVGDRAGTAEFSIAEDSAYSSMIDTGRKSEVARFVSPVVTLDEHCGGRADAVPAVVKIDVEGAELKVLQGGTGVFGDPARRPRFVLIELYDQNLNVFGTSIGEVVSVMAGWGYRPYVLVGGRREAFEARHHNLHYNVFFTA